MPNQTNTAQGGSPFEIVSPGKSKAGGKKGLIVAILVVVFLILSVVAGVLLVRQQQNIQEKAASALCPGAEACPYPSQPSLLRSCHPADADGTVQESLCNVAGRVETCGPATTKYCCPGPNQAWTTDMTKCPQATPTPTPTPSHTPTPTPTPTPTATVAPTPTPTIGPLSTPTPTVSATPTPTTIALATPTPTVSATARPIPVTGTDWPTYVGGAVGVMVIVGSILLAL